jgi:hypothetical protein
MTTIVVDDIEFGCDSVCGQNGITIRPREMPELFDGVELRIRSEDMKVVPLIYIRSRMYLDSYSYYIDFKYAGSFRIYIHFKESKLYKICVNMDYMNKSDRKYVLVNP